MNRQLLIRALARWAQQVNPNDLTAPLLGIEQAILANGFQEGRMLVKVNEAGGTAEFQALPGWGPPEIVALVEEAIQWITQQPNPAKPRLNPRRIMRLTANFGGYTRSLDHLFDTGRLP